MKEIRTLVEKRKEALLQIKKEKEKALQNVPPGALRICHSGSRTQYYHRRDEKDSSGIYIPKSKHDLARKLAQKEYDRKVLGAIEKELNALQKYLSVFSESAVEQIYEKLHKERQKLVIPIKETDEQYIQRWEDYTYQRKGFEENFPEYYTAKMERVRSKSELIIADLLNKEKIPYRYEAPIYLRGAGQIYPDFTVLNVKKRKELYWEHLGMMDDPNYAETALQRISVYEQNGIFPGEGLIITYETRRNPLNQKLIMSMLEHYLKW